MSAATCKLFRQGRDPAILCAVPDGMPTPAFIARPAWFLERTITIGEEPVDGFQARLARTAMDLNGFYLFLDFQRAFHNPAVVAPSLEPERLAA